MIELREPYAPRPVRFLRILEHEGWRLKVYGIAYSPSTAAGRRDVPRVELAEAAEALARRVLPLPARADGRYGVGYVGVHDGRGHNFVLVDWWADENELHHRVFVSPGDQPAHLEEVTATGLTACVWDLAVMGFERDAWVRCVLDPPDGTPDVEAYLELRLHTDI